MIYLHPRSLHWKGVTCIPDGYVPRVRSGSVCIKLVRYHDGTQEKAPPPRRSQT